MFLSVLNFSLLVIPKRAIFDGLMKNLKKIKRDSSEAGARSKAQNDGEQEILRKQRKEARLRMTVREIFRGESFAKKDFDEKNIKILKNFTSLRFFKVI